MFNRPTTCRNPAGPGKQGGHKPNILSGASADWLIARAQTDFTLRDLVTELAEQGVQVDYLQVWRFGHARRLSCKESVLSAGPLQPRIARRREQWRKYRSTPDTRRPVFIDDTWGKTNMAPLRG
jgi:hypothetical protein